MQVSRFSFVFHFGCIDFFLNLEMSRLFLTLVDSRARSAVRDLTKTVLFQDWTPNSQLSTGKVLSTFEILNFQYWSALNLYAKSVFTEEKC